VAPAPPAPVMPPTVIVTGGAGFIGRNLTQKLLDGGLRVVSLDNASDVKRKLMLQDIVADKSQFIDVQGDARSREIVSQLLRQYEPRAVVHLAAEIGVDQSIEDPLGSVEPNVAGALNMLQCCEIYRYIKSHQQQPFKVLIASTDQVYGSAIAGTTSAFTEEDSLYPSSPHSASKVAVEALALSYFRTFELPVVISRCATTYGPFQSPNHLIPATVSRCNDAHPLHVYGDGFYNRQWLHVSDHVEALMLLLKHGEPGEIYNVGTKWFSTVGNIVGDIRRMCRSKSEIVNVTDRPGHDRWLTIRSDKIESLGWRPRVPLSRGLSSTVSWYMARREWVRQIERLEEFNRQRVGLGRHNMGQLAIAQVEQ